MVRRRDLIAGLAALPLVGRRLAAAARTAPKRNVLSVNLRSSEMRSVTVDALSTYSLTLPLETDIAALRVGFANIAPAPYRLDGVCCCEADGWSPKAGAAWAYPSFSGRGESGARAPAASPQSLDMPGNTPDKTGAVNIPKLVWSDWLRFPTHAAPARPQLLLRVLVPPQTLPMTYVAAPGDMGWMLPGARGRLFDQQLSPGDLVKDPQRPPESQQKSLFSPIFVIQYRVPVPGIQIVVGGDSHLAAWVTFPQLVALDLSRPSAPVAVWNAAWSAQPSNTFWPCLDDAIEEARPSLSVIQGWTANDGMNPATDEAYLARVRESADRTSAEGGVPVIIEGMPRELFGRPELASWQRINAALPKLDPQALVFDANPYVEDPSRPGSWRPGLSDDAIHPNLKGNLALVEPFERLIKPLLG